MRLSVLARFVRGIPITDVLLASCFTTTYVYFLAERLPEIELIPGSRIGLLIDYATVACICTAQIIVALKFNLILSRDEEEENYHVEVLRVSKLWLILSYIFLLNWLIKAGIYSERSQITGVSVALGFCIFEVSFRVCGITLVKIFVNKLQIVVEEEEKLEIARQAMRVLANRIINKNTR